MKSLALSLTVGALACFTAIGSSQAAPVAGDWRQRTPKLLHPSDCLPDEAAKRGRYWRLRTHQGGCSSGAHKVSPEIGDGELIPLSAVS